MAGITGTGTTYNLPNYAGILHQVSPTETPLFSAIGGLTDGGKSTKSTAFEWQTVDLRDAAQPEVVEGAAAPTAQARARANVSNVVQIHQEKVAVAYSKLSAVGLKAGINNTDPNPVLDELDFQVQLMLAQMARDIEFSFVRGAYQAPANNSTGRKTRGIIAAVSSNSTDVKGAALPTVTATASTDKVNSTAHGLSNGDSVVFTALTGGAGLAVDTPYFVVNKGTNDFQVSTTKGGSAIDITSDASAATAYALTALTTTHVDDLLQSIFDNGGVDESTVLAVGSAQKRRISAAYAGSYGKYVETTRNIGGVNVTQLETDFGRIGIMLNRYVPKHKIVAVNLGQCAPVYLDVPGKGHFFAEPLAKTGSSEDVQLYGEVGLEYGNERTHGLITGLAI